MGATAIDPTIAQAIITDWRVGQLSQRHLADQYKVSVGYVAKITKGVPRDCVEIVSAGIAYNQALAKHDERIVSAIEQAVDERVKRQEWLNHQALKNLDQAMKAPCDGQADYNRRADTISKTRDVVIGKSPDTAIQINNSPTFESEYLKKIQVDFER